MRFSDYHPDLDDNEYQAASEYYRKIRQDDLRLSGVEHAAIDRIRELTGYTAIDVGSFGLGLNLEGSDLDIAIGVSASDHEKVLEVLTKTFEFKGIRRTSVSSHRHVFVFSLNGVEIDVGVLPAHDLQVLSASLEDYHREMTEREKIIHVWHKKLLKESGDAVAYAKLKLYPYARFCPSFDWVPIT